MLPFLAILAKFLRNVPLFGQKSRFFRDIVPLFVFDGLVSMPVKLKFPAFPFACELTQMAELFSR